MKKSIVVFFCMVSFLATASICLGAESVKVGVLLNLTGYMSSVAVPALDGIELAVEEINNRGGLQGRSIDLVVRDGHSDMAVATSAAEDLVESGVVAVIGLNDSSFVLEAAPIIVGKDIPFICVGASMPRLPRQMGPYLFLTAITDEYQARAMSKFAINNLNATKCFVLSDEVNMTPQAVNRFLRKRYVRTGGDILDENWFRTGQSDFKADVELLSQDLGKPQVIFACAVPGDATTLVESVRAAGYPQPIVGGAGLDTPLLTTLSSKDAAEVYFLSHAPYGTGDEKVKVFEQSFEKKFGLPPFSGFAALGYDAAMILDQAVINSGAVSSADINKGLDLIRQYNGVTGHFVYPEGHRVPLKTAYVFGLKDGKPVFVRQVASD